MAKKQRKSSFKGKVSANVEEQAQQQSSYGYLNLPQGVSVFKEGEDSGKIKFDIVPYEITDPRHLDRNDDREIAQVGDLWYKKPFRIHRNIGMDNDTVVCPQTIGKKCPVCEYRQHLIKKKAEKEEVDATKTSLRNLYIIIPRGHKKHEEEIHVWDISHHNFQRTLNEDIEENPDYEIFPDIKEGLTLRVRFAQETFGKNKFLKATRVYFDEREEQLEESILDEVPNLDEILQIQSYEKLRNLFFEEDIEEDDESETKKDEEEEETRSTKKKGKREEEEEEEEEDEKPKTRKSRRPKPKEEDEEEEEKPKPKSRSRKKEKDEGEDRCPHEHRFGVDTDKEPECINCRIWEECDEANEK